MAKAPTSGKGKGRAVPAARKPPVQGKKQLQITATQPTSRRRTKAPKKDDVELRVALTEQLKLLKEEVDGRIEEVVELLGQEQEKLMSEAIDATASALKVRADALDQASHLYEADPAKAFEARAVMAAGSLTKATTARQQLEERLAKAQEAADNVVAQQCRKYRRALDAVIAQKVKE